MEKLVTRAYNRFEVDETRGVVRKLSSTERLRDEILYYVKLQKYHPSQAVFFPRLLDHVEPLIADFWMDLELYSYPNVGNYLFGDKIMPSWSEFFLNLRNILVSWSNISPRVKWTDEEIRNAAYDMYITKTEREYRNFYSGWHDKFDSLFIDQVRAHSVYINNKQYSMFEVVWPQIKNYIEQNMLTFTPSLIHGDCCFSNILYGEDKNIIRFIDPRGSFGKLGNYGDIRYDIAKLYHSLDGTYEAFITDKFKVTANGNAYQLDIKNDGELDWALNEFEYIFFPMFNKKEIKIIQGCIFIGMCARHYDSLERQRAMYLTGIRLLNEALEL
jgi:hypothetical protein